MAAELFVVDLICCPQPPRMAVVTAISSVCIAGHKDVATEMDRAGLSARQAADQLGHANITTQKHYFGRERVVTEDAAVMEQIAHSTDPAK